MKMFNHPHIVRLYEVMETNRNVCLVMEHAAGGELFDYILTHGRLSENDGRHFFRQIVSAIDFCHRKQVIHRDLKVENLLLDEKCRNVKLADFGFSNHYAEGRLLRTWCGSPPYAAPELFQGKPYSGPQVDLWSLGVVLYVLITGSLPFDGDTVAKLKAKVLAGDYRMPYFVSFECCDLVSRLLVVDPDMRIGLDRIKEHPWYKGSKADGLDPWMDYYLQTGVSELNNIQTAQVLRCIERVGVDRKKIERSLEAHAYDAASAIYYLIADRLYPRNNPQWHHDNSYVTAAIQHFNTFGEAQQMLEELHLASSPANTSKTMANPFSPADKNKMRRFSSATRHNQVAVFDDVVSPADNESKVAPRKRKMLGENSIEARIPEIRDASTTNKLPNALENTKLPGFAKRWLHSIFGTRGNVKSQSTPTSARPVSASAESTVRHGIPSSMSPPSEGKQSLEGRASFSLSVTCPLPPERLTGELRNTLLDQSFSAPVVFETEGSIFACRAPATVFEISVCAVAEDPKAAQLQFSRTSGDPFQYRQLCSEIVANLKM